jgi:hypothetical protein
MNWTDVMNGHTAKNIMALSVADQKQVIRNYCNEHPLASYCEAVIDLAKAIDRPGHDHVELALIGIANERIKGRHNVQAQRPR